MQTPDFFFSSCLLCRIATGSGGGALTQDVGHNFDHRMTRATPHANHLLDTVCSSAASSTTAAPVCGPLLLWLHRGACAGPGACTPVPTLRLLALRSCPPAPGETS